MAPAAVFFINKFRVAGIISEGINGHIEEISEVGVDEMQWDDMSKNEMQWNSVREVGTSRAPWHLCPCLKQLGRQLTPGHLEH